MSGDLHILLGNRIRRRRRLLGLTQGQLGAAIGASPQTMSKYEIGANGLSALNACAIASALGMSIADLLGGLEGDVSIHPDAVPVKYDKVRNLLVKALGLLPAEGLDRVQADVAPEPIQAGPGRVFTRREPVEKPVRIRAHMTPTDNRAATRQIVRLAELPKLKINLDRAGQLFDGGETIERAAELLRAEMGWQA